MSYILEALKKAQAERQLGSAPTIHAVPIEPPAQARAAGGRVALAALAGGLVALAAAFAWWRQGAPAAPAPQQVAVLQAQVPPPAPAIYVPVPVPVAAPAVAAPRPLPPPPAAPPPRMAAASPPEPAPPPVRIPPPSPEPAAATPGESLPYLSQLPDSVRLGIPQVAFGGYMYSTNPDDRLLLIDKVLRHEGEEVAPGLVLEQLLPKAAVMNYRGTRYRLAY